jgi:hypothetical protein
MCACYDVCIYRVYMYLYTYTHIYMHITKDVPTHFAFIIHCMLKVCISNPWFTNDKLRINSSLAEDHTAGHKSGLS